MNRLTTKTDWRWDKADLLSPEAILRKAKKADHWACVARSFYTPGDRTFLELGCAPGDTSAMLTMGTRLRVFGVDFSDDSGLYLEAMRAVQKEATLYQEDVFDFSPGTCFDIVASCGLVEHFRGNALEQLLTKHDELLSPGGLLIIEVPNMTGLQYFWHYLFDKPDLRLHNIDVMQPTTFSVFEERGYTCLFSEYLGQCQLWGTSRFKNNGRRTLLSLVAAGVNVGLNTVFDAAAWTGIKLTGEALSPVFLYVARKPFTVAHNHSIPPQRT